jgi:amidase
LTDSFVSRETQQNIQSPGGSSTGSAVGVSAGYAPNAIGTDTTGSVINPATRAALYGLRVTPGIASMDGVIQFSRTFDSLGAMAKKVRDLADILTIMIDPTQPGVPREGYASNLEGVWSDLRVGFVAPDKWQWPPKLAKQNRKIELQLVCFSGQVRSVRRLLTESADQGYQSCI